MKQTIALIFPFFLTSCQMMKQAEVRDNNRLISTMSEHSDEVQACYERVTHEHSWITGGTLKIAADINPSNQLENIREISGFPGSQQVLECLRPQIQAWQLEPFETHGGIEMEWAFNSP